MVVNGMPKHGFKADIGLLHNGQPVYRPLRPIKIESGCPNSYNMDYRAQCPETTVAGEQCKNKVMPCGKCGKHHIKPCIACMRSGLVDARGRTIRKSHARKPCKSVKAIVVDAPRLVLSCDDSADNSGSNSSGSNLDESIEQYVSESSVHDNAPEPLRAPARHGDHRGDPPKNPPKDLPADNLSVLRDRLADNMTRSTTLIGDIDKLQTMLEFYSRMTALKCAGNLAEDIRDTKKEIIGKLKQLETISADMVILRGQL